MRRVELKEGLGKHEVFLHAQFLGKDLAVNIGGGEVPHIGAVALASPRLSISGDGSNSASCSVICITGHKEDELARKVALELSTKLQCYVTVTCGIHIDEATLEDLKILGVHTDTLVEKFLTKITS